MKYTRQNYISNKCSHREYYGQFVNDEVKKKVLQSFSLDTLRKSLATDEHFNGDITPMKVWDIMGGFVWSRSGAGGREAAVMQPRTTSDILPVDYEQLKEAGEGVSSVTMICIYKEAARQITEQGGDI